ncbi:MAG: hypothetical protein ACN6N7_03935 [Chryseobacterium culicis]
MKKKLLPLAIVLLGFCKAYSQMGINTASPAATLDINAKKATGTSTSVDGVLITRLDRQRAQSMTGVPASTLIYVNSIATGSQAGTAVNIDAVGYYYYDGTAWVKLHNPTNAIAGNIYNTDGTLTGNRTVTQGANTLAFTGTQANAFSVDGATFSVDAANDRIGVGTTTPNTKLTVSTPDGNYGFSHTNGTVDLTSHIGSGIVSFGTLTYNDLRLMTNNFHRLSITAAGDVGIGTNTPNTKLTVSTPDGNYGFSHTNGTVVLTSYIGSGIGSFGTTSNNDLRLMTNNFPRLSITSGGNVGVNTSTPQEALHVNGSVQVTGEIKVGGTATTAGSAGLSNQVLVSQGAGSPAVWKDLSAVTGPVNLLTSFSEFVTNNITFPLSTESGPTLILGAKNGLKVSSPNNIVVIYIDIDAYVNGLSTSAGIAYLFKTNITNSAGTEIGVSSSGSIGMDGTNFADTKKANFRSFVFRNVPVGTFNVGIFAQRGTHNNLNGTTSGNNDLTFLPGNVHIYVYEKN